MLSPMKRGLSIAASLLFAVTTACSSTLATSVDATLKERILASLHAEHLDRVTVTVKDAAVTLEGVVGSEGERAEAQVDAERVDGVKVVRNNLRIDPSVAVPKP